MARSGQRMTARKPLLSRLAVLFALLAFAIQGYAVQTHIHGEPLSANAHITHISTPTQPAPQDPYDPANCPLCQEMMHAGVYIAPALADFAILLNAVAFVPAFTLLPHTVSQEPHGWQSRAPPRH
jgi:hypothetical protein